MQIKHTLTTLGLTLGLAFGLTMTGAAQAAPVENPAAQFGFNQKFEPNGKPIEGKPGELRSLIEFRTARGFSTADFKDVEGNTVNLSVYHGKMVLVDVWATWCEPCIRNLPAVKALQEGYNKEGSDIQVISIALDQNARRVTKFIEKHNFQGFHTWHDPEQKLSETLPLDVIPSFFVLDGHGRTVGFVRGFVDWSGEGVPAYLEALAKKYAKRD